MTRSARGAWLAAPVCFLTVACGAENWAFDREFEAGSDAGGPPRVEAASEAEAAAPIDASDLEDGEPEADPEDADDLSPEATIVCLDGNGCPASLPVCRAADHVCIRCTVDGDCLDVPGRQVCNTTTGGCVQCNRSSDCVASSTGLALPHCDMTTSTCVACLTTADCPRESFCIQSSHTCTPPF